MYGECLTAASSDKRPQQSGPLRMNNTVTRHVWARCEHCEATAQRLKVTSDYGGLLDEGI